MYEYCAVYVRDLSTAQSLKTKQTSRSRIQESGRKKRISLTFVYIGERTKGKSY